MSRAGFAYAQARSQARFAARPAPSEWQMIETGRDLAQALDAAKRTGLAPHVARIGRDSGRAAVEAGLRRAWHEAVAELAGWVPPAWRAAMMWFARLPHLGAEGAEDVAVGASETWQAEFARRLPRGGAGALAPLAPFIAAFLEGPPRPVAERAAFARGLERLLRSAAGTPAAAFAFAGLLVLDFERLRGALLLARMFPLTGEGEAA